eukprot:COSAG04_NODE_256_length_18763_cov_60.353140_7_plen_145_part_00
MILGGGGKLPWVFFPGDVAFSPTTGWRPPPPPLTQLPRTAAEAAPVPSLGSVHRDETAPQTRGHAGNQIVELDANAANYVQGNGRSHDADFQEEMKLAHYRPTPLPVPFTSLSKGEERLARRGRYEYEYRLRGWEPWGRGGRNE